MDIFDHRNLGLQLGLFHIQDDAPGMAFWHPRGFAVYRVLEDYIRSRMRSLGFMEVRSPQVLSRSLWEKSGHWSKFRENMFTVDGEEPMALKPMSCPCHIQIFNRFKRSWRDLPIRYSEFGACHRDEPSGSLHGLMRTRSFVQDDAHVFCLIDQVENEVARFLGLLARVYSDLGFAGYKVALATRPVSKAGSEELWDKAEAMLGAAAERSGLAFDIRPGEGAFYGPKLEIALSDLQGRSWQCGTIQLDFVLPRNLGASYVSSAGHEEIPVMIHHAVLGSMERFIAILLEHYRGQLPPWLAPDQVAILPVSKGHLGYAEQVHGAIWDRGLRGVLLADNETLSRRIVQARTLGVPAVVVVGAQEQASGSAALDIAGERMTLPIEGLVERLARWAAMP